MPVTWEADRLVSEAQSLALRGLPREEYHRELAARLRRVIGFDAACWHGLDGQTLLLTTAHPEELLQHGLLSPEDEPRAAQTLLASEYQRDDYNAFAVLARRRIPVGILSEATRGRPQRSARYREWLGPSGIPYEMRAVLRTPRRAWGCVAFHRREASGDFRPSDARLLARLSRPIAEGLQASVRADAARHAVGDPGPGMLLLGPGNEVELVTPAAQQLLEPLRRMNPAASPTVPPPIVTLAANARGRSPDDRRPLSVHLPTPAGWLSLHASFPDGPKSPRVAVIIQRTSMADSVPLVLEAHGLTRREREVVGLVACGLSTEQIANRLFLSPWTVQDHLKSIFDKTGARSRRQLRAQMFQDDFLPAIARRSALTADGTLVRDAS